MIKKYKRMVSLILFCVLLIVLVFGVMRYVQKPQTQIVFQLKLNNEHTAIHAISQNTYTSKQINMAFEEILVEFKEVNYDNLTPNITVYLYRNDKDFDDGIPFTKYETTPGTAWSDTLI